MHMISFLYALGKDCPWELYGLCDFACKKAALSRKGARRKAPQIYFYADEPVKNRVII